MKKEFKGQLKGFPKEVVKKILKRQVQQGNKKDVTVFESRKIRDTFSDGFDWTEAKEKYDFWNEVICKRNFNLFFERYPKKKSKPSKNKYAISLVFTKQANNAIEIQNCLRIVNADSKEEAFGFALDDCKDRDDLKHHTFSFYTSCQIKC